MAHIQNVVWGFIVFTAASCIYAAVPSSGTPKEGEFPKLGRIADGDPINAKVCKRRVGGFQSVVTLLIRARAVQQCKDGSRESCRLVFCMGYTSHKYNAVTTRCTAPEKIPNNIANNLDTLACWNRGARWKCNLQQISTDRDCPGVVWI